MAVLITSIINGQANCPVLIGQSAAVPFEDKWEDFAQGPISDAFLVGANLAHRFEQPYVIPDRGMELGIPRLFIVTLSSIGYFSIAGIDEGGEPPSVEFRYLLSDASPRELTFTKITDGSYQLEIGPHGFLNVVTGFTPDPG